MNIFGRKKHAHIGKIYEHFETNYEKNCKNIVSILIFYLLL